MVETALVLPLLLLVVMGAVELSRAAAVDSTLLHASQEAARFGQVNGAYDQPGIRRTLSDVAAQGGVRVDAGEISLTYLDGTGAVVIGSDAGAGYAPAAPCPVAAPQTCAEPVPGDYLEVAASIPWSAAEPLIGAILGDGFRLSRSTTVRIED
jgi:Flp pilus assembly protein TadG